MRWLILFLITVLITEGVRAEEVTTSNILNQNFDSGEWSGTATDRHGSNIVAAHNGDYIQSDSYSLTTDVGLTEAQIQNGFTTNHSFKYWHWNDYNSTVESTLTITGQDETITQNRTYDSVGCGFTNCGSYVTGSDSVIIQRNTESDYSIDVRYDFSDTSNTTSGHYSVDLKELNHLHFFHFYFWSHIHDACFFKRKIIFYDLDVFFRFEVIKEFYYLILYRLI